MIARRMFFKISGLVGVAVFYILKAAGVSESAIPECQSTFPLSFPVCFKARYPFRIRLPIISKR